MDIEKSGVIILLVLALFVLIVAGTMGFTGSVVHDFGSTTNPISGLIIMIVFVIAVLIIFRTFVPESRTASRSY